MRLTGMLRTWNDERGFGFIAPTHGGADLFVHVSAFARDGSRPVVGEALSFELGQGKDGKPQAVKVIRGAVGAARPQARREPSPKPVHGAGWLGTVLLLSVAVVAAWWLHGRYQASAHRRQLESLPPVAAPAPEVTAPAQTSFRCDGRTQCSQMTSCAEATWFINHCPGTQMDGNHDGVPCEQQWCTWPGAR